SAPLPSTVHFCWPPTFSHTTSVLLSAPSPKVDLLSFNFHVPNVGLPAKHIAPAATESSRAKPIVFGFINFRVSVSYCFGAGSAPKFAWTNVHLSPFFTKTRVDFARIGVVFPSLSWVRPA